MKKLLRYAFAALPVVLLLPAFGQSGVKEEGITRDQANQILEELRQIRQLLAAQAQNKPQTPPGPTKAVLSLQGAEMLGSKSAPITMVEFTDYQCPFCQRFHTTVFNDLKKNYID